MKSGMWMAFLCVAFIACEGNEGGSDGDSSSSTENNVAGGFEWNDGMSCDAFETEARRISQEHAACESDGDCTVIWYEQFLGEITCLNAWLCGENLNKDHLDAFKEDVENLLSIRAGSKCAGQCAIPDCDMSPKEGLVLFCNSETQRCDSKIESR